MNKSKFSNGISIFFSLIAVASVLVALFFCIKPVFKLEHYRRVYKNPLSVTAVVTYRDSYDDEGDTDYRSYISYTVNNVEYENIKLQDVNEAEELYPLGTELNIDVSPEDPSMLISKLKHSGDVLILTIIIVIVILSYVWKLFWFGKRGKNINFTPDRDTIVKDAKLTILGRFSLPFFLLLPIAYVIMYLRYTTAIYTWVLYVSTVSFAIWLWRAITAKIDIDNIKRDNYIISQDTLIDKYILSGDDSDTYMLTYLSNVNNNKWKQSTSQAYYEKAVRGSKITSIYLPNRKKPLYHYNSDGDAN